MRRSAISRVEVAVIVVIGLVCIGVLAMLLGRQRENGLRLQCANNFRRQGEAVHAYVDAGKGASLLPPARIADGFATWAVLLAPYLAKDHPLHDWDVSQAYFAQNASVRETILPLYFCPARQRTGLLSIAGDIDPATQRHVAGAVGDYAAVAGTGDPARPWDGADADGPIIVGEVLERQGDRIVRWRGRTSLAAIQQARGLSTMLLIGEKHVPIDRQGEAADGDGSLYDGQNAASCSRVAGPGHGLAATMTDPFNTNFGSAHPGLCQFLHADGSLRTFTVDVSTQVLGQMARREP